MTIADKYMVEMIERINTYGFKDENPRPHYADGTPAHTYSVNHTFRQYNLYEGDFPICSLRPIAWKTGIKEIFSIYQKPTNNLEEMHEMGINYWDDWDIGDGTIGQRYGATVKRYDLVNKLIEDIQKDPYGRRHIISLWQNIDLEETPGLAPCAFLTIWNVRYFAGREFLDMVLIQRSGDMMCASGPGGINEVQYAALQMMIARHLGYNPGIFSHFVANEQIYDRHMNAANELLIRYYNNNKEYYDDVYLELNPKKTNFYDMTIDDFEMVNYEPMRPQLELELGI